MKETVDSQFFLRLDRMADDREARGWDPTVTDATTEEVQKFCKVVKAACNRQPAAKRRISGRETSHKAANSMFVKLIGSVGDPSEYPRRKVSVLDGQEKRDYIVGRPTSVLRSPTGRATRGFVAMSVKTGKLVFLKDSWRPNVSGIEAEDHWYKLLQQKEGEGMDRIGAYSHGSDVYATRRFIRCPDKKQRTTAHLYAKEYGRKDAMMGYVHHRVVLSELYLPLEMFRDSKHLVKIMYDIALALKFLHKAGIFHRDISIWNIMIDAHGNGRLIDFDMARLKDGGGARQNFRTGTWQFISLVQLLYPGRAYEVSDELESFFFVIFYMGLHWIIHNKPPALNMELIFDDVQVLADGRQTGGLGKQSMYLNQACLIHEDLQFEKSPPFTDLIRGLYDLFQDLAYSNIARQPGRKPQADRIAEANKLNDCEAIIQLMKTTIERKDWPGECDKVAKDNYPRKGETDEEDRVGKAAVRVSTLDPTDPEAPDSAASLATPSTASKREREEDDDGYTTPMKRSKVEAV